MRFRVPRLSGAALGGGIAMAYLSLMVLIPLAAVVDKSFEDGFSTF
jgi:ABC-type sulfate transport system permease component